MANLVTLADPTDFGNKPGDGPLRVGGVPGEPERGRDKPSTRSPQSAQQKKALGLCRDLWDGTDRVRMRAQSYLPQAPGEKPQDYLNRLARSVFFNAFRRTVEGLTGLVFRKDPELGEDVPPPIAEHWENIDNAGTHGDVFCRDLLEDDLTAGHAAILVEFPTTDGSQNAAVEMRGEVRPYWVPIKKDDIMSWRTRIEDGKTLLEQIVIRESKYVPDGEFGTVLQVLYRVLFLTDVEGFEVGWKLLEEKDDGTVMVRGVGVYGNQTEIPVAEIISSGRRSLSTVPRRSRIASCWRSNRSALPRFGA